MNQVFVAALSLAGVAVTAVGAWIIAIHQRAGKVDTSEAADLWKEGKDLRDFLVGRIEAQERARIVSDAEITALKLEVRDLKVEVAGLRTELKERWPTP